MRVAVFTGSQSGPPAHRSAAAAFAADLARAGIGVVYGGGHVGLMGVVADAALEAGGEVVGVIPQHLVDDELAHPGLPRLEVVASMHERKARMAALLDVDGFWQPLLAQLRRMVDDGYLDGRRLDALGVVGSAKELLGFVEGYEHPARKWRAS